MPYTGQGYKEAHHTGELKPRFVKKSGDYLRSFNFGVIKTGFASVHGGTSPWARRAKFALISLPILTSMVVGATHLVQNSFMVYLKYQGMVDAYYYQVVLPQQ